MSERIYPPARDKIIRPPTMNWPGQGGLLLGNLPSATGGAIDRGILPQLLRQGIGQMGSVHEVEHFAQKFPRLAKLRGQLPPRGTGLITGTARARPGTGTPLSNVERASRHAGIYGQGVLDRIKAVRERATSRFRGQTIQPTPWGPREWPKDSPLTNLPSVGSIMSGPERTMYAMLGRGEDSSGDGRDISIAQEWDNPYPEVNLASGMSVHVE